MDQGDSERMRGGECRQGVVAGMGRYGKKGKGVGMKHGQGTNRAGITTIIIAMAGGIMGNFGVFFLLVICIV